MSVALTCQPPLSGTQLRALAHQVRRDVIRSVAAAGMGHPGGALGAAELFAALYGAVMRHDPAHPDMPERDRFVLSNGHICAALYSVLSRTGYFPAEELGTLRKLDSRLQGHPARTHMPEMVETSSGPLDQGLSVANGLALAARLDRLATHVFCLVGDGELQEGLVWEAVMSAAHFDLARLTLFVSYNGLQIDGEVDKIMRVKPLADKFTAFGWHVLEIDGHDLNAILESVSRAKEELSRPTVVIARTVMGKGVPYMENRAAWHGGKLSWAQAEEALAALGLADGYRDFPYPGVGT